MIKLLQRRALNRNPDEFYFHMQNSKTNDGQHTENEKEDDHSKDQIKLMQNEDLRYITTRRTIERNKIERMQQHLHMIDVANEVPNKHIFFVEDEQEAASFDVAKHLKTHPSLMSRRTNRIIIDKFEKTSLDQVNPKVF